MRKEIVPRFALLLLVAGLIATMPVIADDTPSQPQLPHAFFGNIMAGGSPVNPGLAVEAVGVGVRSGIPGNPITTTSGAYGSAGATGQKLLVQGTMNTGTTLDFYVGGLHAEVFDVVKGGPWKENYTYEPGGYTELDLKIASQPAVGQTRIPTPVQTVAASYNVGDIANPASGGSSLPQVPDSSGQQAAPGGTSQQSSAAGQPETKETSGTTEPSSGAAVSGNMDSSTSPILSGGAGSIPLLLAGVILLIVIAGGAYYYSKMKKNETSPVEEEKKEE